MKIQKFYVTHWISTATKMDPGIALFVLIVSSLTIRDSLALKLDEDSKESVDLTSEEKILLRKLESDEPRKRPAQSKRIGIKSLRRRFQDLGPPEEKKVSQKKRKLSHHFKRKVFRSLSGPAQLLGRSATTSETMTCSNKEEGGGGAGEAGEGLLDVLTEVGKDVLSSAIRIRSGASDEASFCLEIGFNFGNIRCVPYSKATNNLSRLCNGKKSPLCGKSMVCRATQMARHFRCEPRNPKNPRPCNASSCNPSRGVCLIYDRKNSECVPISEPVNDGNCGSLLCPPASSCLFTPSNGRRPATAFCFLNSPKSLVMKYKETTMDNNALLRIILRLLMQNLLT